MTIEERLDKLELKLARARFIINRMLVVIGIGLFLIVWIFASITINGKDKVVDDIHTKSLTIVDRSGKPWASMGGEYGRSHVIF